MTGYYTDFCCPKCGGSTFGSYRNKDGSWTRHCYGNDELECNYRAHEDEDHIHFKTYVPNINY